jgi:hypothetical protein
MAKLKAYLPNEVRQIIQLSYTKLFLPQIKSNNSAKLYKIIFTPNKIYYFIFKRKKTIKRTPLERNFSDLNY